MRLSLTRYLKPSLWVRAALALAVLMPPVWLGGRMPMARTILLPSFGVLALALLLTPTKKAHRAVATAAAVLSTPTL